MTLVAGTVHVDICGDADGGECSDISCTSAAKLTTKQPGYPACRWCLDHWYPLRERYRVVFYRVTYSPAAETYGPPASAG